LLSGGQKQWTGYEFIIMPEKTEVELSDIQGLLRFAHGRLRASEFLLLKIQDPVAARQWLSACSVTTAEKVSPLPETALQLAFTCPGLHAIGLDNDAIKQFSDEFLTGMFEPNRARRLGDTGDNAPDRWQWGGSAENTPHLLLMLYAQSGQLESFREQITDQLFEQAFVIQAVLSNSEEITTEPFGFADGISQPTIDWERVQTVDLHRRDKYSNLLTLGEMVFGYQNEYGEYTVRPLLDASKNPHATGLPDAEDNPALKDLGCNGSYLVLRQLEQDVHGFWQYLDEVSGKDAVAREQLAEAMVGRKIDGTTLVEKSQRSIEGINEKLKDKDNFDFDKDLKGLSCPIGAHIRRSNPRTGDYPPGVTGFITRLLRILGLVGKGSNDDLIASTRFHRILRRGRPYGSTLSIEQALEPPVTVEKRGLQFVCVSTNISRQFEFIQNAWIANSKFADLDGETDPLLGNREPLIDGSPTDSFTQAQADGPRKRCTGLPQFVTVRGGAYFFLPGIRALKYIAVSSGADQEGD